MAVFFLVGFFLVADFAFMTFFIAGSGATSSSILAGSGATSSSILAGSGSSTCSAKNAELSADSGFVSITGFGLVSVNAGFSS